MDIIALDHKLTLALNGSDSIFWDNVMYTVTDTFSWTLVIIALLVIVFKNKLRHQTISTSKSLFAIVNFSS